MISIISKFCPLCGKEIRGDAGIKGYLSTQEAGSVTIRAHALCIRTRQTAAQRKMFALAQLSKKVNAEIGVAQKVKQRVQEVKKQAQKKRAKKQKIQELREFAILKQAIKAGRLNLNNYVGCSIKEG